MSNPSPEPSGPNIELVAAAADSWSAQWAAVPEQWQIPQYQADAAPHDQVLLQNRYYCGRVSDFSALDCPQRMSRELAWWVWLCWVKRLRKIDPSLLRWAGQAVTEATAHYVRRHQRQPHSITDFEATELVHAALASFQRRTGRLPSLCSRRDITRFIEQWHLYLSVHCTDAPWWAHDIWDLQADRRIPQREHEPNHHQSIRLAPIEPQWLREGVRFWLRTSLSTELLRWTSATERARTMARHLGRFLTERHLSDPVLCDDPAQLRLLFTDFSAWLRSPSACAKPGQLLRPGAVDNTRSQTQVFYTFMADHAHEAAAATGNPSWSNLTDAHTRLWGPAFRTRAANRTREVSWYSTAQLQRMLCYLEVLSADRGRHVAITHPDGSVSLVGGLGDPQAARAWLLQAMTGRRASEILMLDYDPIEAIPGTDRPSDTDADASAFVAKLRYQQTKVDGIVPTILIEQAVLNVVREQQLWLKAQHPELVSKYLFVGIRNNFDGQRHRPYDTYRAALAALDKIHGLTDSTGKALRFTQTHRLRHTRATELLNDGVPIHVVQRYLGHKSPEMTLQYAATLAATAEAEFLKHKKIGAAGVDIAISPADIYDMTQLSKRTDRILPNGVCLLPPLKTCDKGNACLSCGHFATDATHLDELREQYARTHALIEVRRTQFHTRTGRELTDENVWVRERLRELHSLQQIIDRLVKDTDTVAATGAGTAKRLPLLQIHTRGAHESTLHAAPQHNPPPQDTPT